MCKTSTKRVTCDRIRGILRKERSKTMTWRVILALLFMTTVTWAQHPDDVFVGQKAPELKGGDAWINSGALKLDTLRGKSCSSISGRSTARFAPKRCRT